MCSGSAVEHVKDVLCVLTQNFKKNQTQKIYFFLIELFIY